MTKRKLFTLALVAVIALTAIAGASLAYFTDTDTAKNTITMGNVKILLDEAPVDENGHALASGDRVDHIEYGVEAAYPGAVLDKDPTVHNIGNNKAYIRVTINISSYVDINSEWFPGCKLAIENIVKELGEGWSVVKYVKGDVYEEAGDGQHDAKFILKYEGILAPGESTTPIFEHVYIPAKVTNETAYGFDMDIVAHAIQSAGFDSWEDAFAAFDESID